MQQINNGVKVEFKSPEFFGTARAEPKPTGAH
jgi:hypothetical protein